MAHSTKLLPELLSLPIDERTRLVRKLLESLDPTKDENAATAWLDELEIRNREIDAGTAELEDWGTAKERIAARLRAL